MLRTKPLALLAALVGIAACGNDRPPGSEAAAIKVCREGVAKRLGVDKSDDDMAGPGIPVQHLLTYAEPGNWLDQGLAAPRSWTFRGLSADVEGARATNFECRVVRDAGEELELKVDELLLCPFKDAEPWGCTDPQADR